MIIRENIADPIFWDWKCPFYMNPQAICIHNTGDEGSADNNISYMRYCGLTVQNGQAVVTNPTLAYTSFHYAVDDVEAVQGLPLQRAGWHAGDGTYGAGNRTTIGIEICWDYAEAGDFAWEAKYKSRFEKAQKNAAELCCILMHDFGWGCDLNRITKHADYSPKHCPHRTLDYYGWQYFLNLVKDKYEELYPEEFPMTKAEKKSFDALVSSVDKLTKKIADLEKKIPTEKVYQTVDACPSWARPTIKKLVEEGKLKGTGSGLGLTDDLMRVLVINDRSGLY